MSPNLLSSGGALLSKRAAHKRELMMVAAVPLRQVELWVQGSSQSFWGAERSVESDKPICSTAIKALLCSAKESGARQPSRKSDDSPNFPKFPSLPHAALREVECCLHPHHPHHTHTQTYTHTHQAPSFCQTFIFLTGCRVRPLG